MNAVLNSRFLVKGGSHEDIYNEFKRIMVNKNINSLFQPIVDLATSNVFGFEALTRGPRESCFFSPINLFTYAEQIGCLYELEKIARESAFSKCETFTSKNNKIFINISSQVIHDPNFTPGHTISLLNDFHLSPSDIVFEITERSAIQDFTSFKEVLKHYRDQGFKIAVDDAGAGYSSLQAISELMPDFIKVDRSLVSGIHENKVKRHILEAFVTFAKKTNSSVIAEGVETSSELKTVIELGIDYAQGYYLARPNYPVSNLKEHVIKDILQYENPCLKKKIIEVQLDDEIVVIENGQFIKKLQIKNLLNKKINPPQI